MIPMEMYQCLVADREARFQVLDRIWERLPDLPLEDIAADVEEAIADLRAGNAAGGS